ncbi:MAG: UDP-N-acetylmuramoyl-tripeptide--D-alanyl-D-alanine ligase [Vicinamibacterales bacterium]
MTPPFPLTAGVVADACDGRVIAGDPSGTLRAFSTDTRSLQTGDAFIALVGPRFDGHRFVKDAVSKGASALIVSAADVLDHNDARGPAVILVPDTLGALQSLARYVRRVSGARVVAVTGSAGKTTTKEATALLLSSRYRTLRNRGNLNNHIGLPLSLLELQNGHEIAVVELGMNHAGEIAQLVSIAEPDVRVWTNVGHAHLEHFASVDAIADAKAEILLGAGSDTVFVANVDDPRVSARMAGFPGRVVTFGIDGEADVRAASIVSRGVEGQEATVRTSSGDISVRLRLPGRGHLANVLAAVAVALYFDVPLPSIAERVATLAPARHRGELVVLADDVRVFDDCYNSSPGALLQTLDVIAGSSTAGHKMAILGEMLELGVGSVDLHRECGRATVRAGVSKLVTVGGPPARALADAAIEAGLSPDAVVHTADHAAAVALIDGLVSHGDLILVKGSRGIGLDRVVAHLVAERG